MTAHFIIRRSEGLPAVYLIVNKSALANSPPPPLSTAFVEVACID